jgi:hypothetical protein
MKRWLAVPLTLALLLTLQPGCASMVRYQSPSLANEPVTSSSTVRSLGFLWGLVPPSKISLEQCGPQGIHHMKVRQGFIDGLITYGTGGFVISYKVKIWCSGAPTD